MTGNIVDKTDDWVKIERVLISVWDKTGLDTFIPALIELHPAIRLYSTGGTYRAILDLLGAKQAAAHLVQVSAYTGQPETQGGLVKTLDFKIYLGLLTETYNEAHQADLRRTDARPFDMVVCNLYPFQATVARAGVTAEEARANIDIGGPCMIRAAAKNYIRVAAVVDPGDYGSLADFMEAHEGQLDLGQRFDLARKAFAHTAAYEQAISNYLAAQEAQIVLGLYSAGRLQAGGA